MVVVNGGRGGEENILPNLVFLSLGAFAVLLRQTEYVYRCDALADDACALQYICLRNIAQS